MANFRNFPELALGMVLGFVLAAYAVNALPQSFNPHRRYISSGTDNIISTYEGDKPDDPLYTQCLEIEINLLRSNSTLTIDKASLVWGQWRDCETKDKKVEAPNGVQINSTKLVKLCVCGKHRPSSPSGVVGSLNIYDDIVKVTHLYFDCPWRRAFSASPLWTTESSHDWMVTQEGFPTSPCREFNSKFEFFLVRAVLLPLSPNSAGPRAILPIV